MVYQNPIAHTKLFISPDDGRNSRTLLYIDTTGSKTTSFTWYHYKG